MATNRQIQLAKTPTALPEPAHFRLVETPVPVPAEGELLCRNLWLSLDPYMRSQIAGRHLSGTIKPGDLLRGETIAEVMESKHPDYKPGQLVRGFGHWQLYCLMKAKEASLVSPQIPEPRWALGCLGMPGLTAWAGLTQHVNLQPGQTLLLPAVTGAVGTVAAGIARHRGVSVIGVAGSEEKQRYALDTLGCTHCLSRHSDDPAQALKAACPEGVNVYFDLVGGYWLQLAAEQLAIGGHIILCGLMAEYNSEARSAGPSPGLILRARGHISGLVVYDYENRRDRFVRECLPLVEAGVIQVREDITQTLEQAPSAFCRLMRGENFGKALVQLGS